MAAILCKSVTGFCEFLCTAPCKACGSTCKLLSSCCTNPLSAFVGITLVTQIPVAVVAAMEIPSLFGGCKASQWLLGMLLVALVHSATSIYLGARVTNPTDDALRHKHTAWERISYLLCHDPWIALYILVVFFFLAWLCVGTAWSLQGIMGESENCSASVDDRIATVFGLDWFYVVAGPIVLSCNLCCVCCDKRDYAGDDAAFASKEESKKRKESAAAPDIESPSAPMEEQTSKPMMAGKPPRTYSADGIPVYDANDDNVVLQAEAVVEEEILPPPIMPPSKQESSKGSESKRGNNNAYAEKASKAQAKAEKVAGSVTKKVGGWMRGSKSSLNEKHPAAPDTKATIY